MADKIIVVTRKTALEELIERFNTRAQARFYIEHAGASFDEYQAAHDAYQGALGQLKEAIPEGARSQFVDRAFLPNFTFAPSDLVVTLGPDGLVVNTAKYLSAQPLLAFNPDPQRIDGVLLPFTLEHAQVMLGAAMRDNVALRTISMAQASLNDGQSLLAVNDLFIGQSSHVSARYTLNWRGQSEDQSSSGIIVSTGAGSTGWLRSVLAGASRIAQAVAADEVLGAGSPGGVAGDTAQHDPHTGRSIASAYRFDWEAPYLYFSVREPFESRTSGARLVFGRIEEGEQLEIVSRMPQNGVIFSDGVEEDFLEFNAGAIARIELAPNKVNLIVGTSGS